MIDIRQLGPDDARDALRVTTTALLIGRFSASELVSRAPSWALSRSLGAFDGPDLVGHVRAWPLQTTVPGGARLATAGISSVGVLPTHTRRGILRSLKTAQLRYERELGTVLASLRASEAPIYGRFGYGLAGLAADYAIERSAGALTPAAHALADRGRVRLIAPEEAAEVVPPIYERATARQVGAIGRPALWWGDRLLGNFGSAEDRSLRWIAVHEGDDGALDGYVDYEVPDRGAVPGPAVAVRDLFAADWFGYAALWRHLLGLDLAASVTATLRPIDEALRWMLVDPRALRTTRVVDEQWARLIDIEAALAARTYAPSGDQVVVSIDDPVLEGNGGRFAVSSAGAVRVGSDGDPVDLSLRVAEAGAVYLGATSFVDLLGAGRIVEHRPGAASAADRLFGVRPLPWCGTFF